MNYREAQSGCSEYGVYHPLHVFAVLLLLSAILLEIGNAAGFVSPDVLGSVSGGLESWWQGGWWTHVLAAVLLLTLAVLSSKHLPRRIRWGSACAVIHLYSHL